MVTNVINRSIGVAIKLNVIAKIHKYKGFYEGHHFIPMVMEVHDAFERDMDHFIKKCIRLFYNR